MPQTQEKGYLASVVGLSGAGKSTAIRGVRNILTGAGISSASFHDRTSDPESAKLDELLHTTDLSPEARMHLIIAARRQIIDRQIIPSMQQHDVTITDRYYPCTIAYQAYGERLDRQLVGQAAISAAHGALPNRIFLLDIPGEFVPQRIAQQHSAPQLFDDAAVEFHGRVRQGYLDQAEADPETFVVVDGLAPREQVAQHIAGIIHGDLSGLL